MTPMAWTDGFSGWRNPNWRDQVRQHLNATTPFDGQARIWRGKRGKIRSTESRPPPYYPFSFEIKYWQTDVEGYIGGFPIAGTPPPEDATVANAAVIGFLKKIRSKQRALQGGVILGEARETLHMLRNPAMALRRRVDNYLGSLKESGRRRLRDPEYISGSWLEAQFGWAPLVNDIKDAAMLLEEQGRKHRDLYEPVRFSARNEVAVSLNHDVGSFYRIWTKVERSVKHRTQVRYLGQIKIKNAGTPTVDKELLGFAWEDFVPTVWELVPWSFLIDYFSNIGDVIEAWTTCTSDLAWSLRTSRRERVSRSTSSIDLAATRSSYWKSGNCSGYASGNCGWVEVIDRRVVRSVGITDSPRISFEIPGFGKKWINIAALIASRRELRNSINHFA